MPLALAGRTEEAVAQVSKMREMYPEKLPESVEQNVLSYLYYCSGDYELALEKAERHWELYVEGSKDSSDASFQNARATHVLHSAELYEELGKKEEAQRLWDEYTSIRNIDTLEIKYPLTAADYHMWQGDLDRAFFCLERAYEQKNMWLTRITTLPWYRPLRDDPRYDDLVKRMGLRQ